MEAVKFIDSIEVKHSEYNSTYDVVSDQFSTSIVTTGYHSKTVIKVENPNRLEAMFIAVSDFARFKTIK
jgi:ribonuclease HIII